MCVCAYVCVRVCVVVLERHNEFTKCTPPVCPALFAQRASVCACRSTSLWLAKTYVIPAGMYGSQVWGTGFL